MVCWYKYRTDRNSAFCSSVSHRKFNLCLCNTGAAFLSLYCFSPSEFIAYYAFLCFSPHFHSPFGRGCELQFVLLSHKPARFPTYSGRGSVLVKMYLFLPPITVMSSTPCGSCWLLYQSFLLVECFSNCSVSSNSLSLLHEQFKHLDSLVLILLLQQRESGVNP